MAVRVRMRLMQGMSKCGSHAQWRTLCNVSQHTLQRRRFRWPLGASRNRGCVQVVSQCGPHAQWRTHSAACEETKTARDGAHRLALPADAAQLCRMRVRAVDPNGAGAYSDELCVRIPALL